MYQLNHDPLTELERELEKLRSLPTPRQKKKREAQKKEINYLITKIERFKAFYALKEGDTVTNGKELGIVTEPYLSQGGMPQAWVKWSGGMTISEDPLILKPEPNLKGLEVGYLIDINGYCYKIKEFKGNGVVKAESDFEPKRILETDNFTPKDNEVGSNDKTVGAQGLRPSDEPETPSSPQISQLSPETNPDDLLSELTDEEEKDRLFLERKVERAFYEAGKALQELRDRRLYRNTHKTFEEYCRERFGHSRQKANFLIAGAKAYDNLTTTSQSEMTTSGCQNLDETMTTNGCQNPDEPMTTNGTQTETDNLTTNGLQNKQPQMTTNGTQIVEILPTSERQIRPLTKLEPQQQREVWREAVAAAGGKVPSSRIVSDIVTKLKPKKPIPNPYRVGEVITILVKQNPDLRGKGGCWGIITQVHDFSCTVRLWDGEYTLQIQHLQEMSLSPNQREEMKQISDRILSLYTANLEDTAKSLLGSLGKINRPYLTSLEEQLLTVLEQSS